MSLESRFPNVELDAFIVMLNHVHGILRVTSDRVGTIHELTSQNKGVSDPDEERIQRRKMLLPKVIGYFKMNSSKRIIRLSCLPRLRVWQRNYFEHVTRSSKSLNQLRMCIGENPFKWSDDPENPLVMQDIS